MSSAQPPQVLFFDVFGTVVEWRSCVTRACCDAAQHALSDPGKSLTAEVRENASAMTPDNWLGVVEEWRKSYWQFTRSFDPADDFVTVDQHLYASLEDLLGKWNLEGLFSDAEKSDLALSWHRLDPWPDSVQGLKLLNRRFRTSTLSNGNVSLLEDLRDYALLPFTDVTSAEDFGAFKPSPLVYIGAASKFKLDPSECGLVAAHLNDLKAAKALGFQTIYVQRIQEESLPVEEFPRAKQEYVDMWIDLDSMGLVEVAARFGIDAESNP